MPHLPTSETPPEVPVPGATLVAEGATAEAALADVHARLGPDARILDARRTLRGGIGGFFAREVVQLHAAPAAAEAAPAQEAVVGDQPPTHQESPTATFTSPIDRLLERAEAAEDEVDFATFLRRQLDTSAQTVALDVSDPSASSPQRGRILDLGDGELDTVRWPSLTSEAGEEPAPRRERVPLEECADRVEEPPAADDGGPAWSVTTLLRLGLPTELVRSLEVVEPADDLAWTHALATALRPLCRPLPQGRAVIVGPRAPGLAPSLEVAVWAMGEPLNTRDDVAVSLTGNDEAHRWLEEVARSRWIHLVAGGRGWRPLLHADPLAVSWASVEDLPDALRCAVELGLVLGFGPVARGTVRARPLDVAMAVRDLVPNR